MEVYIPVKEPAVTSSDDGEQMYVTYNISGQKD